MQLLYLSLALLIGGGVCSWLVGNACASRRIGVWSCVGGCAVALLPAAGATAGMPVASVHIDWAVPGGSFALALDALSGIFLAPILVLSALAAIYGFSYMAHRGPAPRSHWLFYNLLVAAMTLVVVARNGVLFLMAWETMALASFALVATDDDRESVRAASWTYLVAAHLGMACLMGLFALLGKAFGSLDFDRFGTGGGLPPTIAGAAFLLALAGFGSKAGLVPFHVWLPEAHPAAPSHVSAVMSGVMIKTGIYALVRTLTFLGAPPAWWGWTLVAVGVLSGVGGVLFALAQHDLKRLLAYHSVENIGIIALGIGIGALGMSCHSPAIAALGFAGALLHVVNHALFKGLLFLGAGGVLHAAGTGDLDRLGGLLRRMPRTGLAFLVGSAAIVGLPPLNGFVSEFLLFLASFRGVVDARGSAMAPSALGIAGLALISGLAAACFAKAFGIVFLGEPRTLHAAAAKESDCMMLGPQLALAACCIALGLAGPWTLGALAPAVSVVLGTAPSESAGTHLLEAGLGLRGVALASTVLATVGVALALLRRRLLASRVVTTSVTWDCGYAAPTARMQYSASSFAQPLVDLFHAVLRTHTDAASPDGLFPEATVFASHTPDTCREGFYRPLFVGIGRALGSLRRFQHGDLHLYVLYIAVTMLVLLIWALG